jgi:hypothetical protein
VTISRVFDERVNRGTVHMAKMSCACALLTLLLAGCGHKQVRAHIPVALPVDLQAATMPDDEIEPVPEPDIVPLPWPEPPRPPVRRRAPAREDAGGAAQPTEPPQPPEVTIGMLSPGGEATAQSQQQARDLIASTERRITSLPERVASSQRSQVRRARNYLDDSKKALNTGDAVGAMNLANKAKLLMDELEPQ